MFSYYESNNRKLIIFFYILTNHYASQQRCKETPIFKRFAEGYRISKIKSKASINQILQTIIILRCIYVFCLAFSGLQTSGQLALRERVCLPLSAQIKIESGCNKTVTSIQAKIKMQKVGRVKEEKLSRSTRVCISTISS